MRETPKYQDLSQFKVPPGFRGRNGLMVQLWWLCQATLFALSPQPLYAWRAALLRFFGAEIGENVKIRPSARFTYPWKVKVGDHSWIGDRAELYSLVEIEIGSNCCISQDCYIATSGHDHRALSFDYTPAKVVVEEEVWLASGAFVLPGCRIGRGAVVAARSLVTRDIPEASIVAGTPIREIGKRKAHDAS